MTQWIAPLLWMIATVAAAHDGHPHDAIAATAQAAPRLALAQPPLELVAARQADALVVWIDDYDSNAPLTTLKLRLRAGGRLLQAQPADDGSYRVPLDAFDPAQPLPLQFIVQGHGDELRLDGLLPPAPHAEPAAAWPLRAFVIVLTLASAPLALFGLSARRRRRAAG